jgi:prophage antirepressor-like protein
MIEEIKTDNNCIVKAFENNPISILHEDINDKRIYYFKASDVGKVLGIVNIRTSIVNFDEDEKVVRTTYSSNSGNPETLFLTSQGVYRLLYNSKKEVAKKFRKWAGDILDDIIFNESKKLKEQLIEQQRVLNQKDEMIKLLANKPETEGFTRTNGYIYLVRDKSKPGHYKIGLAEDPNKRLIGLNCGSSTNSLEIVKTYQSKDTMLSEKVIHSVLYPYKIKKQKEWFYIHNDDLLNIVLDTIKDCILFTDKCTFNSMEEHLQYVGKNINYTNNTIKNHIKFASKEIQTDIEALTTPQLQAQDDDEVVFNRFLNESCVFGDLVYCSKRDLVYQYKIWSKINNIFNHKNFEQYLLTKFRSKKMLNKILNCEMCCILGVNLKDSFYNFNFSEPYGEFERFIMNCCIKLPTAKLNRTTIKDKYNEWCRIEKLTLPNKEKIVDLCKFLDKYFFKDKFFQGDSTYLGWYGITIKEDVLKGTGITSTLCKKNKVCKVYKDEPNIIVKEWDSQKTTAEELGIHKSTLKSRIDNKFIFIDGDREFYLVREQDLVKNNLR